MFGFFIALLIVAYAAVMGQPLDTAVHSAATFAFWWHCIASGIIVSLFIFVWIVSFGSLFTKDDEAKSQGLMFITLTPFAFIQFACRATLWITSSILIIRAAPPTLGTNSFEEWNRGNLLAAGILLGVSVLWALWFRSSNKRKND